MLTLLQVKNHESLRVDLLFTQYRNQENQPTQKLLSAHYAFTGSWWQLGWQWCRTMQCWPHMGLWSKQPTRPASSLLLRRPSSLGCCPACALAGLLPSQPWQPPYHKLLVSLACLTYHFDAWNADRLLVATSKGCSLNAWHTRILYGKASAA